MGSSNYFRQDVEMWIAKSQEPSGGTDNEGANNASTSL